MSLEAETVTQLGSGLVFNNTYGAGVTEAYRAAIVAAETNLASQFTNSDGVGFWISSAEARVLGLSTTPKAVDDTIVLNSDKWHNFSQDTVTTLEHEISEGVFGRVSSLGVSLTGWQPMDLFRFSADGQHN